MSEDYLDLNLAPQVRRPDRDIVPVVAYEKRAEVWVILPHF